MDINGIKVITMLESDLKSRRHSLTALEKDRLCRLLPCVTPIPSLYKSYWLELAPTYEAFSAKFRE